MTDLEKEIFRKMSAEKKIELSLNLYYSARQLKETVVKQNHPDWPQERIEKEVREIFLYART